MHEKDPADLATMCILGINTVHTDGGSQERRTKASSLPRLLGVAFALHAVAEFSLYSLGFCGNRDWRRTPLPPILQHLSLGRSALKEGRRRQAHGRPSRHREGVGTNGAGSGGDPSPLASGEPYRDRPNRCRTTPAKRAREQACRLRFRPRGRSLGGDIEPAIPIAPPAADFDHRRTTLGYLAEEDHVLCHCGRCSPWSSLRTTRRHRDVR